MRVVFFGNPRFALPTLEAISTSCHQLVGVVTNPDKPAGKGLRVTPTPVKMWATSVGLPFLQPEKLKSPQFIAELRKWGGEVGVVVGFRIIPKEVIELFPKGCINLHPSLLPQLRGPAPIPWALINGLTLTGVTTFLIDTGVDTGMVLLQREVEIKEDEVATELEARLAKVGAEMVVETLDGWEAGTISPRPQQGVPTLAPAINAEHCRIDWTLPAQRIVGLIRGLADEPGAFTTWEGEVVKIYRAAVVPSEDPVEPGTIIEAQRDRLVVRAGEGGVGVKVLQRAGKKRMDVSQFLLGVRNLKGTRWE